MASNPIRIGPFVPETATPLYIGYALGGAITSPRGAGAPAGREGQGPAALESPLQVHAERHDLVGALVGVIHEAEEHHALADRAAGVLVVRLPGRHQARAAGAGELQPRGRL